MSTDTVSGALRHVQLAEPEVWARAVFAEFDDDERRIYLLGGVDADTDTPSSGSSPTASTSTTVRSDPGADPAPHDAPLLGASLD
ncbi:hypothetical protein GS942_21320 [Rhodococcus hoagii]|nr:hypothetical protein [Prescottella equi]